MKILSHRGYWKSVEEKNSSIAFSRSFEMGFGAELDFRDLNQQLVVSHDPASAEAITAETLFDLHQQHDPELVLALNIKSDGLQGLLKPFFAEAKLANSFVFDMSIPDTLQWLKIGVPVYSRHSDVEPEPALYEQAVGIWLDAFASDWWDTAVIARHLDNGKNVCIVSPELHGREHRRIWDALASSELPSNDNVMLCTDFPEQARGFLSNGD